MSVKLIMEAVNKTVTTEVEAFIVAVTLDISSVTITLIVMVSSVIYCISLLCHSAWVITIVTFDVPRELYAHNLPPDREIPLLMHICITDIDECADGTNGCNHNCSNTNGSYVCFCFNGYELHDNMKGCIGTYVFCVVATLIVY